MLRTFVHYYFQAHDLLKRFRIVSKILSNFYYTLTILVFILLYLENKSLIQGHNNILV